MALSPDASEMEMRVALSGFLETEPGQPVLAAGQRIDLAVGAEAASDHYGASEWGADSTPVMYQYEIQIPRGKRR
jgi:hypothetical protein